MDLQKTLLRGGIGVVAIGAVIFGFRSYTAKTAQTKANVAKEAAAAADRAVPVLAVPAAQRDVPIYLDGLGNVIASATVTVHVQVDGRLDRVVFTEGQDVHKGDLLAQIDPRPFQAQLASAQAAMARDRAQYTEAVKNFERYTELAKSGLSSQQAVDDQAAMVAQLRGTTAADQAAIDTAQLNLNYARVVSPIDGVTGIRQVDQGNIVHQTDATGLVVLTTLDPIAVIFTLPQDDLAPIAKEMQKGDVAVLAMSRDGGTKLATGKVALIDNQINMATATIRLKALFPNKDRALWPNEFVKTRLLLSTRKSALVVPAAVVQHGPQGDFVYLIGPDTKAVVQPVQVDITQGDQTIVAGGLKAGDMVVLDGQNQLRAGSKTVLRSADAAAPKGGAGTNGADGGAPPPAGGDKDGKPAAPAGGAKP